MITTLTKVAEFIAYFVAAFWVIAILGLLLFLGQDELSPWVYILAVGGGLLFSIGNLLSQDPKYKGDVDLVKAKVKGFVATWAICFIPAIILCLCLAFGIARWSEKEIDKELAYNSMLNPHYEGEDAPTQWVTQQWKEENRLTNEQQSLRQQEREKERDRLVAEKSHLADGLLPWAFELALGGSFIVSLAYLFIQSQGQSAKGALQS